MSALLYYSDGALSYLSLFLKKILFYCSRNELNKDLVIIIKFGASRAEIKLFFQILQTQICKCTLPDQQQQQRADVKRASITKMKNQSIKISFNSIKRHIMYIPACTFVVIENRKMWYF